MSGSAKIALPEANIGSINVYNRRKSDDRITSGRMESAGASSDGLDTSNQSPMLRQDTFYADSTIQNRSFEGTSELENLDTIEDEEFETEELAGDVVEYRPRTLLESVDTMLSILDDLGDRYYKWKYGNNGIYRFYCHKYNLTKIDASRPYYTKILSQLNSMNNMSLHLLSSHYQKMSDSAVYSSNDVVDTVLCQLDEFVSCYCCRNCAFAISKKGAHVCSDLRVNHTCLKWKNPSSAERFLTVSKTQPTNKMQMLEKSKSTEKIASSEKAKYLKTKSLERSLSNQTLTSEPTQDLDSSADKQKQEEFMDKWESEQRRPVKNMTGSCFIREMGYYDQCVMEYFSERGIMHNFSHPYRQGEETTFIHSFLKAVVCYNCGKFCRCRCQRKIFRSVRSCPDGSIDLSQFSLSPSGLSSGSEYQETDSKVDGLEKSSMHYVNGVYGQFHKDNTNSDAHSDSSTETKTVSGMAPLDVNTMYSHTLSTGFGKVQFLMNMDTNLNKSKKVALNKASVSETSTSVDLTTSPDSFEGNIAIDALRGSKIDSSMGSVYYSNLFKGTTCKVTVDEIFTIVNNVPFSTVSEELLNHYKKAEWHELYRSPWWCLDDKFDNPKYFEDKGNLEAYAVNVLDALGYLGNLRYDAAFKVIGVGYYRRKYCYWRYFYVNRNLWECFRDTVEYFILISTLPNEVYIDSKLSAWVATHRNVQKKFSLSPSLLKSYRQVLTFMKLGGETLKEPKHISSLKGKDLRDHSSSSSSIQFQNESLKFKHCLKEDYGVDVFDISKVGAYECTVADVIGVALKRKLVSSGDSCTPRRQYIQKATTVTPTVKVKLDPEMIYQGIFASNSSATVNANTNTNTNTMTNSNLHTNTNVGSTGMNNANHPCNNLSNSNNNSSSSSVNNSSLKSDLKLSNVNVKDNKNNMGNKDNKSTNGYNNLNNMGLGSRNSSSVGPGSVVKDVNMLNSNMNNNLNNNNVVISNHLVDTDQKTSPSGYTNGSNGTDVSSTDVSIDLKLNNLNTILSYYPDVCAQYSAITRQANELRVQMSLLMSDLNKATANQMNQNGQDVNMLNTNNSTYLATNNLVNGSETVTKHSKNLSNRNGMIMFNEENLNVNSKDTKENENKKNKNKPSLDSENDLDDQHSLLNGKLANKVLEKMGDTQTKKNTSSNTNYLDEFSTDDEDEVKELPMFDICYNSRNNSWTCLLEVVPCLVCPLECERNGSCLHYTQGKKLIETICSRMKPCDVKYTFHPHFRADCHSSHRGGRPEISVISFSVSQYGHERARLLASQLKATYKIQALNSMLINLSSSVNTNSNNTNQNNNTNNSNNTSTSNTNTNSNNTSGSNTPKDKSNKLNMDLKEKEKENKDHKDKLKEHMNEKEKAKDKENKIKEDKDSKENKEKDNKNGSQNGEQLDKTLEMELLHNAITAQLTTMISTHSYIAQSSYHDLEDDLTTFNTGVKAKNEGSVSNNLTKNPVRFGRFGRYGFGRRVGRFGRFGNLKNSSTSKTTTTTSNTDNLGNKSNTGTGVSTVNNVKNTVKLHSNSKEEVDSTNSMSMLNEENLKPNVNPKDKETREKEKDNKENKDKEKENQKNKNKQSLDSENDVDNWSASGSASSCDFDMDVDNSCTTENLDDENENENENNEDDNNENNESENIDLLSDDNKVIDLENTNPSNQQDGQQGTSKPVRNRPKHYKKKYSLRNKLDNGTCICYFYGKKLFGNQGEVRVSEVLSFNDNLYTFSNMLEVKNILQLNSNRLHYCPLHCCFVTFWKDAMEQTRVMYHHIERFIDFKSFNNMVTKFRNDWPNAIKLHNNYAHSIDATEGARMFAQTNRALTDCFIILLNLQKAINDALVASLALAIRALTDASQEKSLISRLFLINKSMEVSGETVRNSLLFANEILFPFGALHDEATPPLSDDES